jgi:hypothetical protein
MSYGVDVMIFRKNHFLREKLDKKLAMLTQNTAILCLKMITALIFPENRHFFAESCDQSIDPSSSIIGQCV